MGVLRRAELARRIALGELLTDYREKDGGPDLQPASYDLSAGRVVWKEARRKGGDPPQIVERVYRPGVGFDQQPSVTLQPGQMLTVITRESVRMPRDLCATVFSKNKLALSGIFAFNAGHVDPGYQGQIVIRLINLREAQWTLNLGDPVFTIVFQTIDTNESDVADLVSRQPITPEETLKQVRWFADVALSNALFSLYSQAITDQLNDHRIEILHKLREDLGKDFVKIDRFGEALFKWSWKWLLIAASIIGIVTKWPDIKKMINLP